MKSTPGRIRTCDQRIRNPLLYPLSYRGPKLVKELRSVWLEPRPGTIPGTMYPWSWAWPAAFRLKPGLRRNTLTSSRQLEG